ncbi:hypothetical protein [Bacillus phage Nachito]|nr:hypothetical protein [Bacillus phage Nachito]
MLFSFCLTNFSTLNFCSISFRVYLYSKAEKLVRLKNRASFYHEFRAMDLLVIIFWAKIKNIYLF